MKKEDKPLVSFVLPTYNRIAWLAECIESLRKQTVNDIEIIVVDDCSSDSTPKLIDWFCKKDSRIVYVRNDNNLGAAGSRNVGNNLAKADIICVADSDDYYPDYRAEETLKFFKKVRKPTMFNGSYLRVNYSNEVTAEFKAEDLNVENFKNGIETYFCHPSAAYRKEDILKTPYRKEEKGQTDDFQLVTDWITAGNKIKATDKILCFHRVLPGSIMTNLRNGSLE